MKVGARYDVAGSTGYSEARLVTRSTSWMAQALCLVCEMKDGDQGVERSFCQGGEEPIGIWSPGRADGSNLGVASVGVDPNPFAHGRVTHPRLLLHKPPTSLHRLGSKTGAPLQPERTKYGRKNGPNSSGT